VLAEYFIPPTVNQAEVKKKKRSAQGREPEGTDLEMQIKESTHIQPGDMPEIVRERVEEQALEGYDVEDVRVLLVRWCDEQDQVGYSRVILVFGVLSIIA
jgi:hypothetical protein